MAVAGAAPEFETAQEILDELLDRLRIEGHERARYRQRLGHALLMEAIETAQLFTTLEGEEDRAQL